MKDNNDFKPLTLQDMTDMWWKEQERLGKIKPILTMSLVDGEWIYNYDGKAMRFVEGKWVADDDKKSLIGKEVTRTIEIPNKQWFALKEACGIKGVNFKSVCNKPYLKPNNGIPDGIVNGRKCWRRETILEWITQTDEQLKEMYKKKKKP